MRDSRHGGSCDRPSARRAGAMDPHGPTGISRLRGCRYCHVCYPWGPPVRSARLHRCRGVVAGLAGRGLRVLDRAFGKEPSGPCRRRARPCTAASPTFLCLRKAVIFSPFLLVQEAGDSGRMHEVKTEELLLCWVKVKCNPESLREGRTEQN
jgi:hypothetical protein